MLAKHLSLWACFLLVLTPVIRADDAYEKVLTDVSDKLAKQLIAKNHKKVAVIEFVDLQGRPSELGRYLTEQLTVELVGADKLSVMDRANIKSILKEHKLSEDGLIKPENAKKLGEFAGIDVILIGTVAASDKDIKLMVKAITTDTAEIAAAARGTFLKTAELERLSNAGIFPNDAGPAGVAASGATASEVKAIATKDVASLRVALRDVTELKGKDDIDGHAVTIGVECTLDVTNTDLRRTVSFAVNAKRERNSVGYYRIASATNSVGHKWPLLETTGLPLVAAAFNADTSAIVRLIREGKFSDSDELFSQYSDPTYWGGSFQTIDPGKTVSMTLSFKDPSNQFGSAPHTGSFDSFNINAELVIGASEPGAKQADYRLETLRFDKITLPSSK